MTLRAQPSRSGRWLRRWRTSHGIVRGARFSITLAVLPLDTPGYTRRVLTQREFAAWLHCYAVDIGHTVSERSVKRWEQFRVPVWVCELLDRLVPPRREPVVRH